MTANALVQGLSQLLFVIIFVSVGLRALRYRSRASIDMVLFFGAIAWIVIETWLIEVLPLHWGILMTVAQILAVALPYVLLRLADDYLGINPRMMRAALCAFLGSVGLVLILHRVHAALVLLILVAYFVVTAAYAAGAFIHAARQAPGVTCRRMRSIAAGTLLLSLAVIVAGFQAITPASLQGFWSAVSTLVGLASGLAYYAGFTPPGWLRRAWQEPELRGFLVQAASLPRERTLRVLVLELERGVRESLGVEYAVIGLWNSQTRQLEFPGHGDESTFPLVQAAFSLQFPVFSRDLIWDYPQNAEFYRSKGLKTGLAVPIRAGQNVLGALSIYAPRAPLFAEDDLDLSQLLAGQAAVVLESRALIEEAARVQAHAEAARLKDDFLSSAAHDLKTPLTAIIAQAQLLERRARRRPDAPVDLLGVERLVRDAQRMRRLVLELLDVSRAEQGRLLGAMEDVDVTALVRELCALHSSIHHSCVLEAAEEIRGLFDQARLAQLVDNLLDNAAKYSPDGTAVQVRLRRQGDDLHMEVVDHGIGILPSDLPHLFDRFHRGSNVDDRRFAGMGLGLYICRQIAEQHGGQIWATSDGPNEGSIFHVVLPLRDARHETVGAASGESFTISGAEAV